MHFTPAPHAEPLFAGSEGEFHKTLARFNQERFTPANPGIVLFEPGNALRFHRMEVAFLEAMRQEAQAYLSENPADPEDLVAWFERAAAGAGEQSASFFDWLAECADSEQVRWVLQQEIGTEAAVPDVLALSQVRMPARVKIAMARTFWEEMGRGEAKSTHSEMLEHLAHHFAIRADLGAIIPEALAQENLLNAMGAHRQYAFHAAGALGITALLNDERAPAMMRALTRLKVPAKARKVFAVQAARDPAETRVWLEDVIAPLARRNIVRAQSLSEGAVMRLMAAARDVLMVGGEDQDAGAPADPDKRYARLESWARARFPRFGEIRARWIGGLKETRDNLALLGRRAPGSNVYIVDGDSGVGFTHAAVGAMIIRDTIEGRDNPWAALFDPLRFGPAAHHLMASDAALGAVG